jgi:hypothetical protein
MRRGSIVLLALITCGKIDQISISESSRSTIARGTLVEMFAGDIGFGELVEVDITESQELQNQGVSKEQVDSVKLTALTLTALSPAQSDFTFLDSVEFFVEAPGLERKRIARGGPFDAGDAMVELAIDDVELAPYAVSERMTITTDARGNRPDQDTTVEAQIDLLVDVNVSGVICGS